MNLLSCSGFKRLTKGTGLPVALPPFGGWRGVLPPPGPEGPLPTAFCKSLASATPMAIGITRRTALCPTSPAESLHPHR